MGGAFRPERAGAALFGLAWAAMTAGALAFFASPHSYIMAEASGNAYAAAWAVLFTCFEACVAIVNMRGRGRGARISAVATALACIGIAVLIACWGAGEAAARIPPMVC